MSNKTSGRISLDIRVLDGIHHGAGVSGNTARLRVQEIIDDEGNIQRVPWVSGSSFKHTLRDAGARHAIGVLGIKDGSMSKAVIDLLFSGGHLTKSGAAISLAKARRLEELFPMLMLGYSAGNTMRGSRIHVDNFHLVCEENKFRTPENLRSLPHANKRSASFRSEEFGTRHEASKTPHVARLLDDGSRKLLEEKNEKAMTVKAEKLDSSQMIFDFQTIAAGSRMFSTIYFDDLSPLELGALRAALSFACQGGDDENGFIFYLGAKRSSGWGKISAKIHGEKITSPATESLDGLVKFGEGSANYEEHLKEHRDEIISALHEAVK